VKRLPTVGGVIASIGALVGGALFAPAALAIGSNQTPAAHVAIQVFRSFSSFSAASRVSQTITFDDLETGTSLGSRPMLGPVDVRHSSADTFKTWTAAFVPESPPNVLTPWSGDSFAFGDTTLTFPGNTRAAGLFLILPVGSNEETIWTSTVTATDAKHRSISFPVDFRGMLGEQQFIGFKSQHKLVSISFGVAVKADGASAVIAMDDIVVD
jgi:hypothetical protein